MGSRPPPQEQVKEILAKKDVDEVLEYIEGNKNLSNDKKRQKKERQKQQRLEELRAKQEEERKRKARFLLLLHLWGQALRLLLL